MALSAARFASHAEVWCARLQQGRAPARAFWPKFLFRHESIDNAISVLRSGQLLSRSQACSVGFRDVAAVDVLERRCDAHEFVRLYFRPKTPTQFHIEGVRKPHELWHGAHARVLVMLVFHASPVLCRPGTCFSDGNMQSDRTTIGETDAHFDSIDFEHVYHSSALPDGPVKAEIIRQRCAEVLTTSPLPLEGMLAAVLCRSPAERSYLQHLLGAEGWRTWASRTFVHTEPGIFEKRWAFVESVDQSADGFYCRFHSRQDGAQCDIQFQVFSGGRAVFSGRSAQADLGLRWKVPLEMRPGRYKVHVSVDGCLAYEAEHVYDDQPF